MITESDVVEFITICDEVISKAPVFENYEDFCLYFQTDHISNPYASNFLKGFLEKEILNSDGEVFLKALKSALYRREKLFNLNFKYSFIAQTLHYFIGNHKTIKIEKNEVWINVVTKIVLLSCFINDDLFYTSNEDKAVSDSVLFLAKNGYAVGINGGIFTLTNETEISIAIRINQLAKEIGGRRIIQHLLKEMRHRKWHKNERYSIPNSADTNPQHDKKASLPFGYILNISAKHLEITPQHVTQDNINYFFNLITSFISVYDVEIFNAYSLIFIDEKTLPKYITDAILREVFFNFKQLAPDDCLLYLDNLFSWVDNNAFKAARGWGLDEYSKIAKVILNPQPFDGITLFFTEESICKATKLTPAVVKKILNEITHKTFEINSDYLLPNDYKNINLHKKPLIWQKGKKYLMLDPALAGIGLVTALMSILRDFDSKSDSKIGDLIEEFVFNSFQRKNIEATLFSKKYEVKKQTFECDVVVENGEKIIFIESKKKTITSSALSGDPVHAIIDLSLSFFSSQKQILNHYLNLLKNNEINFKNGYSIKVKEKIDGISISLFDWGMLQNRIISQSILRNFLGKEISAPDFEDQEKIIKCNKIIKEVSILRNKIIEISNDKDPIYDFVFLSVPHILHMIRLSKNKEDFFNIFSMFKRCIVSGKDVHESLNYLTTLIDQKDRQSA